MIPVLTADARHRAAIAELPLSLHTADRPAGAIVVVAGADWVNGVRSAIDAGAVAVVVEDPDASPHDDLDDLVVLADSARVPVILERPLLRADVADEGRRASAEGPPAVIVVDGAGPASRLRVLARDAVGWARALAGGPLTIGSARDGVGSLTTGEGTPVAVNLATTARPGGGWLRVAALGDPLVEIEIEGPLARVTTAGAAGRLTLPTRFESSARLALRRAAAALASGEAPHDVRDLATDVAIATRLLAHRA